MKTLRFFASLIGLLLFFSYPCPAAPARLEPIGTRWDASGNFISVFRLTNTSSGEISFPGYSASSPAYTLQLRHLGRWRDEPSFWCGVGFGTQRLAPHRSEIFTVLPPKDSRMWRIGIKVTMAGWAPKALIAWTKALITDADIVRQAPNADAFVRTDVLRRPYRNFPYTFTLTNTSDKPLFYGGFKETHVPPIYLNQERRLGRWIDDGSATWCGTSFGFRELPQGGLISFSIPAQSLNLTWRIGVRLYRTAQPVVPRDAYSPVWWPPLPRRNRG